MATPHPLVLTVSCLVVSCCVLLAFSLGSVRKFTDLSRCKEEFYIIVVNDADKDDNESAV